jgi:hypothetical protein
MGDFWRVGEWCSTGAGFLAWCLRLVEVGLKNPRFRTGRCTMRLLCILFLVAVGAAAYILFHENDQLLTLTFFGRQFTAPVATMMGIAYVLGMLTGWSLLGLLRRSFSAATDFRRRDTARVS